MFVILILISFECLDSYLDSSNILRFSCGLLSVLA